MFGVRVWCWFLQDKETMFFEKIIVHLPDIAPSKRSGLNGYLYYDPGFLAKVWYNEIPQSDLKMTLIFMWPYSLQIASMLP